MLLVLQPTFFFSVDCKARSSVCVSIGWDDKVIVSLIRPSYKKFECKTFLFVKRFFISPFICSYFIMSIKRPNR